MDAVQLKGADEKGSLRDIQSAVRTHLAIWLESKKRLLEFAAQKPAAIRRRSKYAIGLYAWAKKYVSVRTRRISLEELRKVLGLDSVKDADGNVIREAPLSVWANLRQRALDVALS